MLRCIYGSLLSATPPHVANNRQSLNHEIPTRKNWTHKITTRKNFRSTKHPQEKYLHPWNTREKKNLDPGNTREKIFLKYSRWHDDFKTHETHNSTRPTKFGTLIEKSHKCGDISLLRKDQLVLSMQKKNIPTALSYQKIVCKEGAKNICRRIKKPAKHLRWNALRKWLTAFSFLNIFAKHSTY